MCALCAIWHFSAFYGCFYAHSMSANLYTLFLSSAGFAFTIAASCGFSPPRGLSFRISGAKVRYENHSDKLLCENFTMKCIFRPKAVPYVS